jgi:hypothetical protein
MTSIRCTDAANTVSSCGVLLSPNPIIIFGTVEEGNPIQPSAQPGGKASSIDIFDQ